MPTYDYRCLDCHRRFDIYLSYKEYGDKVIHCTHCGSSNVQRRIGRIRMLRSEESRMESLGGMDNLEGLEQDPRELGRMMRKMSSEVGEDMGPEFNEVIGRLEAGQPPEDIEKDLPDFGGDAGMGGMGGMSDMGGGLDSGALDDF